MRLLVTKWFGVVLLEDGRETERIDFPADAQAIAERLLRVRRGEVLAEERQLASGNLTVTTPRLAGLGALRKQEQVPPLAPRVPANLLREAALLVGREESRESAGEKDRSVVAGVRALDELTKTANTLTERVRDWYALHYPEAVRAVPDALKFAAAIAESPDRQILSQKLGLGDPKTSIGVSFPAEDLEAISRLARALNELLKEHDRLERLLEKNARAAAPTLCGVVGPMLAARLMSLANGLEALALMPASTLQTLGAENALFLHLKEGNRPPKHGVLFQHPVVNVAPRWHRGKLARSLSTHASRAAKLDHFSPDGGDRSAPLRAHFETQVARIKATPQPQGGPSKGPREAGRMRPAPAGGGHWAQRKADGAGGGRRKFPPRPQGGRR